MSIAGSDLFSLSSLDENEDDRSTCTTFGNESNDIHENSPDHDRNTSTSFADILDDSGYREDLLSDDSNDDDEFETTMTCPRRDTTSIRHTEDFVQQTNGNSPEHHHPISCSSDMLNDSCYRDDLLSYNDSDDDEGCVDGTGRVTSPSSNEANTNRTRAGESVLHSLERDMIAKNSARPRIGSHNTEAGAVAIDHNGQANHQVNTTPTGVENRPPSLARNSPDEGNYLDDIGAMMDDDDNAVPRSDPPKSGESAISQLERDIVIKNQCRHGRIENQPTEMMGQDPDREQSDFGQVPAQHPNCVALDGVVDDPRAYFSVESTDLANVAMSETIIELTELANHHDTTQMNEPTTELADGSMMSEPTMELTETHVQANQSVLTVLTAVPQEDFDTKETRRVSLLDFLIGLAVGVAFALVVLFLVALFVTKSIIKHGPKSKTFVPTLAPSLSPTQATIPALVELFQSLSNVATLQDPNSAQNQAMQWIANLDAEVVLPRKVQLYVLAVFYFATGGENWDICGRNNPPCDYGTSASNWLLSENECSWPMVHCNKQQEVVALEAGDFLRIELTGTVPSEIQHLSKLKVLRLINHGLSGPILSYMAQMENLTTLELQDNQFSGDIGATFFPSHSNLTLLNLAGNNFSAHVPETIEQSSLLNILDVSRNRFSGEIPSSVFGLSTLRELVIGDNDFLGTIDAAIGSMTSLSILSVDKTMIGGELPSELFSLSVLEKLQLNDSNFQGPLNDTNFQKLTKLRIMHLQNNDFTGPLPIVAMEQSTSLKEIRLDGNDKMTGEVSEAVCTKRQMGGLFFVLRVGCSIECRKGCCNNDYCPGSL